MKMKEMLKNAIIDALNSHKLDEVALRRYLQQIADEAEYNLWFFGHFHEMEGLWKGVSYDNKVYRRDRI